MSNSTKDKQVLLAILNVKKYAKNLKKKASNLQDPTQDLNFIQAVSSPSFFQPRLQQGPYDLNSPVLFTKSSYNESFESFTRQKKQHSMTHIPAGLRKIQKESRKNSDVSIPAVASPSKTFTYSSQRTNLSQSYKLQNTSNKQSNNTMMKKQRKQSCRTQLKLQSKQKQRVKEKTSEITLQQFNNTITLPLTKTKQISTKQSVTAVPLVKKIQDPKIVQQLLEQITKLKQQIYAYKKSLVVIRTKYLEMQQKCHQKVISDHLVDALKIQILALQQQKQKLNQTIKKQNEKIVKFQQTIIDISKKFSTHFMQEINKITKLKTQNSVYKQLLFIKTPVNLQLNPDKQIQSKKQISNNTDKNGIKQKQSNKSEQYNCSGSESQSQSEGYHYQKPLTVNTGLICKNQNDIQTKYSEYNTQKK